MHAHAVSFFMAIGSAETAPTSDCAGAYAFVRFFATSRTLGAPTCTHDCAGTCDQFELVPGET